MTKPNGKIELSDADLEYLRQIHNARALRELVQQPGWEIFQKIIADMIARMEDQHLSFVVSGTAMATRDAYWLSGARLGGIRQFAKIMTDQIAKEISILEQPLRPPSQADPADMDGDATETDHGNQ